MPRFFFDVDTGDLLVRDEDGQEMTDTEAARVEAAFVVADVARGVLPDGLRRDVVSTVRDADSRPVFRITLSLRAEWL